MTESLVGLGAVCVVAAAAGGGLKALGTELPVLKTIPRQALVGVVGLGLGFVGFTDPSDNGTAVAANETTTTTSTTLKFPDIDSSILKDLANSTAASIAPSETTISLSRTSGPPGTVFRVSGTGFEPNERIEIKFHVEILGEVRADDRGDFAFDTQVPDTPFQTQHIVRARGKASFRSDDHPFQVT